MIIEYDESGMITHVRYEPIPPSILPHLEELRIPHLVVGDAPKNVFATHYVHNGALVERPVIIVPEEIELVANGEDEFYIPLPDPCKIRVDGEDHIVEGGQLVLSADMPAEYVIEINHWPYMPATIKVTANAPESV